MAILFPVRCRGLRLAAVALALIAAAGCGRRMCPVEGKVTYRDGAPLPGGMVIFESLEADVKTSWRGHIGKDGSFRLGTEGEEDGVPEGRYRVLVVPLFGVNGAPAVRIDPKYERPETSPLEYTVVRGKNEANFEIDRPAPAQSKNRR